MTLQELMSRLRRDGFDVSEGRWGGAKLKGESTEVEVDEQNYFAVKVYKDYGKNYHIVHVRFKAYEGLVGYLREEDYPPVPGAPVERDFIRPENRHRM